MKQFTISKSCHGMDCIQGDDLSHNECIIIRALIMDNWLESEAYKLKGNSRPFLQGFELPMKGKNDGWVLVEFWTENQSGIQKWIDFLNKKLKDEENGQV